MNKEIFDNILEVKEEYPDLTKIDDIELLSFLVNNLMEEVIENSKTSNILNLKVIEKNYEQAVKLRTINQNKKDFLLGYLSGLLLFSNKFWENNPALKELKNYNDLDFEDYYDFVVYVSNEFLEDQKKLINPSALSQQNNKNLYLVDTILTPQELYQYSEEDDKIIYDISKTICFDVDFLKKYTLGLEEEIYELEEYRVPLLFFHSFFSHGHLTYIKNAVKNEGDFQLGLFAGTIRSTINDFKCQIINTKNYSEIISSNDKNFDSLEERTHKRYEKHVTNGLKRKTLKKQRIN